MTVHGDHRRTLGTDGREAEFDTQFGKLAFDFSMPDESRALQFGKELAFSLRKLWHKRGDIWIAYDETAAPT